MPGPQRLLYVPELDLTIRTRRDMTPGCIADALAELRADVAALRSTTPAACSTLAPVLARMPSGHPEFADAQRLLLAAHEPVGKIHRVYAAGDRLAERDEHGVPRQTILYMRFRDEADEVGEPWTAMIDCDGDLLCRAGWGDHPVEPPA